LGARRERESFLQVEGMCVEVESGLAHDEKPIPDRFG